ncbi:MAG: hypothetical protein FJ215_11485, partial [Ignavibacteria bacterium]|nr:hypothetical protein [Ignavibacteria bacterium]
GIYLANVPYDDAKSGLVWFVADGENPIGLNPQRVDIGVTGAGKEGVGRVWLRARIEKFSQLDSAWANIRYDNYVRKTKDGRRDSTDAEGNLVYHTIASKGCALTAMAIVAKAGGADITPRTLSDFMNDKKTYGFNGTNVRWDIINRYRGNKRYKYHSDSGAGLLYKSDRKTIDVDKSTPLVASSISEYLSNGYLVIAQVYNPSTSNGHWVVVYGQNDGEYVIVDPGCYSDRKDLSGAYRNRIYRFIVYRKT